MNQDQPFWDDAVLLAWIVLASRCEEVEPGWEPVANPILEDILDAEDEKALDALGPDLIQRIMAGQWKPKSRRRKSRKKHAQQELAGALNRDDGEHELTSDAKAEMERKIRELEQAEEDKDQTQDTEP